MPKKKLRVEVSDEEGNRYSVCLEGNVTRKKATCLLDIIELLGGVQGGEEKQSNVVSSSKFEKTRVIVEKRFPLAWFSSKDVLEAYEQEFNEHLSLSTVSTYLSRMADRGFLMRQGQSNKRTYRIVIVATQKKPKFMEER